MSNDRSKQRYLVYSRLLLTLSKSVAVALSSGFLTRHNDVKSINSGDHLSGSVNVGGGLVGIIKIACESNKDRYMQCRIVGPEAGPTLWS